MRMEERAPATPPGESQAVRPWPATYELAEGGSAGFEPRPGDLYAAIDDLADGVAVLRVSEWPDVDGEGRLAFPGEAVSVGAPAAELQALADAERTRHGQLAPTRPLRVGDTFALREATAGLAVTVPDRLADDVQAVAAAYGARTTNVRDLPRGTVVELAAPLLAAGALAEAIERELGPRAAIEPGAGLAAGELVDVSGAAREAAKAAYYGAAASALSEDAVEAMAPGEPVVAAPGVFDIRMSAAPRTEPRL
ncbi:MAG: hypothetical protein IT303_02865 [Dehalococcoidia bacterium]|nr:hypothetical protein [Dehalococcoidia bacterium]